jgi:hypothetical protein
VSGVLPSERGGASPESIQLVAAATCVLSASDQRKHKQQIEIERETCVQCSVWPRAKSLHAGSSGVAARGLGLGREPRVDRDEGDAGRRRRHPPPPAAGQAAAASPLPVRGTRGRQRSTARPTIGHHELRQATQAKEIKQVCCLFTHIIFKIIEVFIKYLFIIYFFSY